MTLHTENFEIVIGEPAEDGSLYGWYRNNNGMYRYAVSLWFYDGKLADYDEVGEDIPKEVLDALEAIGFNVDKMRPYQVVV